VTELVDVADLKSAAARRGGSSPSARTSRARRRRPSGPPPAVAPATPPGDRSAGPRRSAARHCRGATSRIRLSLPLPLPLSLRSVPFASTRGCRLRRAHRLATTNNSHAGARRTHRSYTEAESMKKMCALALLIPALAFAKSPFDGTWKTRPDSMTFSGNPDVFELSNGVYSCASCAPPYKIKADGTDQPVPEHDYLDHQAAKVVSPSVVEFTDKKAGKVMATSRYSVSADGKKLSGTWTSYVGEKPITGGFTEKRIAAAPAGAHAISGSWQTDSVTDLSDAARIVVLQSTPNGLKMMWNGQTTEAKFDGKEYPTVGDPGKTMITLKRLSETQIEETDRRRGKVFDVVLWTVAADGKTITTVDTDPVHGTKVTSILEKQP
jgi:hypothetical protein